MLHFNIKHSTTYLYSNAVWDIKNQIKTYPIEDERQKVFSHLLSITENPIITINKDAFGNKFGSFTVDGPTNYLNITSTFDIETVEQNVMEKVKAIQHNWDEVFLVSMDKTLQVFLHEQGHIDNYEIKNLISTFNIAGKDTLDVILEFNSYINLNFKYMPGITNIDTPISVVWGMKAGVCQDFALILIEMLRTVNIPARYMSGYICPNNNGMKGDAGSHAWVEAYLPNYGWLGVDPTNNCLAEEKHVRVAFGRNYDDVSPIKGQYRGNAFANMEVKVEVGYH
ncbi:MAG: transglutaminase domain-containing protein [Cytophagales bacterium]